MPRPGGPVDVGAPLQAGLLIVLQSFHIVGIQAPGEGVAQCPDVQLVEILAMALGSAHRVQLQPVLGVDLNDPDFVGLALLIWVVQERVDRGIF